MRECRTLFRPADDLQSFCQVRGWRFCFIGGIAIQRWGEPRLTARGRPHHPDPDTAARLPLSRSSCGADFPGRIAGRGRVRAPEPRAPPSVRARHSDRHLPRRAPIRGKGCRPSELLSVPARCVPEYVLGRRPRSPQGIRRPFARLERHRGCHASFRPADCVGHRGGRAPAALRSEGGPAYPAATSDAACHNRRSSLDTRAPGVAQPRPTRCDLGTRVEAGHRNRRRHS